MAKIAYIIVRTNEIVKSPVSDMLAENIVSAVAGQTFTIIARYGTNKSTLKKILDKHNQTAIA